MATAAITNAFMRGSSRTVRPMLARSSMPAPQEAIARSAAICERVMLRTSA